MHRIVLAGLLMILAQLPAAQEIYKKQPPKNAEEAEQFLKQQQVQMNKFREQQIKALRKINPEMAKQQEEAYKRDEKIHGIIARSRQGKLSKAEATTALYPLVKESLGPELSGLKDRITCMEQRLASLKRAQSNPELFAQQRIEEMLSPRRPERYEPIW